MVHREDFALPQHLVVAVDDFYRELVADLGVERAELVVLGANGDERMDLAVRPGVELDGLIVAER